MIGYQNRALGISNRSRSVSSRNNHRAWWWWYPWPFDIEVNSNRRYASRKSSPIRWNTMSVARSTNRPFKGILIEGVRMVSSKRAHTTKWFYLSVRGQHKYRSEHFPVLSRHACPGWAHRGENSEVDTSQAQSACRPLEQWYADWDAVGCTGKLDKSTKNLRSTSSFSPISSNGVLCRSLNGRNSIWLQSPPLKVLIYLASEECLAF